MSKQLIDRKQQGYNIGQMNDSIIRILNPKAQRQQRKKPTWKVHAYFLDACNCDWGCPCQFNAKPTHYNPVIDKRS